MKSTVNLLEDLLKQQVMLFKRVIFFVVSLFTVNSGFSQTYYGNDKRVNSSQVNWSEIMSDLSNDLSNISNDRARKREWLAQVNSSAIQSIDNSFYASGFSQLDLLSRNGKKATKDALSQLYTSLTSGRLNPDSYPRYVSSVMDRYNQFEHIMSQLASESQSQEQIHGHERVLACIDNTLPLYQLFLKLSITPPTSRWDQYSSVQVDNYYVRVYSGTQGMNALAQAIIRELRALNY